jgi:hypothetical protein
MILVRKPMILVRKPMILVRANAPPSMCSTSRTEKIR